MIKKIFLVFLVSLTFVACAGKTIMTDNITSEISSKDAIEAAAPAVILNNFQLEKDINRQKSINDSDVFTRILSIPEPDIRKVNLQRISDMKTVYFDFNSTDIKPAYRTVLEANAKWLQANSDYNVLIEGHTDNRGSTSYNLGLGQERATKVRAYLAYLDISPYRLATISYGEEKPASTLDTEDGWQQNRRVELLVFKPTSKLQVEKK